MQSKMANKILTGILCVGLMLQVSMPVAYAEEIAPIQETKTITSPMETTEEGLDLPEAVTESAMLLTQSPSMTLIEGAVDGGDINAKGLELNKNTPTVVTQYKAGAGSVLFTPASKASSGKNTIELNNATLEAPEYVGSQWVPFLMVLPSGDVNLIIKGNNKLIRSRNCLVYGRNCNLQVTGDGTLSAAQDGILLENESIFTCDENTSEYLNLIVTTINSSGNKQEIFGSASGNQILNSGYVNLILHRDAEFTLRNADGNLYGNLDIAENAKFVIGEDSILNIGADGGALPVVTNKGGSIVVKGQLNFEDSSYAKYLAKMNIITQGNGKVLFEGQLIDPVSGKLKFNDSLGIRLSATNGSEYSCGQGTMKWEPVVNDQGELISGTLTLNNADIIMKGGNKGAITVDEGKNVPITLNLVGNNSIENPYSEGIAMDDLTLTGSGTLTGTGELPIVYRTNFNLSNFSGKLNAMVARVVYDQSYGMRRYGTAYGTVSYISDEYYSSYIVENGAQVTIEPGASLKTGTFTSNGTVINNGTLGLKRDVNDAGLKNWVYGNLNLKGNGIVIVTQIGGGSIEALFTNDGQLIHDTTDTSLDFSNATEDKGDLAKDGYHWDNQNKKLTLQNLNMWGNPGAPSNGISAITLPEGKDVTLELKGYNKITGFKSAVYQGSPKLTEPGSVPEAKGSLTVCGDGTLVTENQTYDQIYHENILTTTGKLILESGNLLMASVGKGDTGIAAVGMDIKGGSIGSKTLCVPIESYGNFTMSGGKVITEEGDGASLMVAGNLTLSGGDLITRKAFNGIMLINGNLTITGGNLTVQNGDVISSMGVTVQITGKEDKKISISGGTVDIKAGMASVVFGAYFGGTGKGILETNGMTLTTYPKGGTLKAAVMSIKAPKISAPEAGNPQIPKQVTVYALTADDSLKAGPQGLLNACTSLTAGKTPLKPSDGGNSNSNGTSGNHSGGGSAATTASTAKTNTSSFPTQAKATVTSTVTNGTANVTVSQSTVADVIKKAQEEAKKNGSEKNGIAVEIKVDTRNSNANNLSANLPKATVAELVKEQVKGVSLNTDLGKMSLDLETLKTIQKQVGADVNVSVKKVDNSTLSAQAKAVVGNRPVFDFAITGTNGTKVTNFEDGKITVSIPYTLDAREKAENVVAYYIDNEGKVQEMPNCVYDEKTKTLSFVTDHFSMYAVGYKADTATTFTDIATHWAKEEIQFVTEKGLFSGTAQGKFSPNVSMTRGMFVTVLGRLAKADVSSYTNSSFTDVKKNAYYSPYIQWAGEKGIVKGISETGFAPDQSITREQMAVIMASYAKATGFELPQVNKESTFADNGQISSYAKEAVKQMQMAGILDGKDGNKFDPKGTATRAEVSAVLKRFAELVEKK